MEMPMPQQFSSAGLVLDNCTKNTILSTVHKNHAAKMCKVYIRYDIFMPSPSSSSNGYAQTCV